LSKDGGDLIKICVKRGQLAQNMGFWSKNRQNRAILFCEIFPKGIDTGVHSWYTFYVNISIVDKRKTILWVNTKNDDRGCVEKGSAQEEGSRGCALGRKKRRWSTDTQKTGRAVFP